MSRDVDSIATSIVLPSITRWGVSQDHSGTYIGRRVLLLRADDGAASRGRVQSTLALDRRLTLGNARAADLAADLGDGIPVRHFERFGACEGEGGVLGRR